MKITLFLQEHLAFSYEFYTSYHLIPLLSAFAKNIWLSYAFSQIILGKFNKNIYNCFANFFWLSHTSILWKMHGQSKCLGIFPPNQEVYNSSQILLLMSSPSNLHLHRSHMQQFIYLLTIF